MTWDEALCRDQGRLFPDADWFPERENSKAGRRAVKVCRHCPLAAECLAQAMRGERRESDRVGIFAGMTADDRRAAFGPLMKEGRYPTRGGDMCSNGHPYENNVYVSPAGQRQCKTCRAAYHRKRYPT